MRNISFQIGTTFRGKAPQMSQIAPAPVWIDPRSGQLRGLESSAAPVFGRCYWKRRVAQRQPAASIAARI